MKEFFLIMALGLSSNMQEQPIQKEPAIREINLLKRVYRFLVVGARDQADQQMAKKTEIDMDRVVLKSSRLIVATSRAIEALWQIPMIDSLDFGVRGCILALYSYNTTGPQPFVEHLVESLGKYFLLPTSKKRPIPDLELNLNVARNVRAIERVYEQDRQILFWQDEIISIIVNDFSLSNEQAYIYILRIAEGFSRNKDFRLVKRGLLQAS